MLLFLAVARVLMPVVMTTLVLDLDNSLCHMWQSLLVPPLVVMQSTWWLQCSMMYESLLRCGKIDAAVGANGVSGEVDLAFGDDTMRQPLQKH